MGRDTVNQVGKITPNIIKKATGEVNKIAQQRIDQAIRSDGSEIEQIAPKIIRGAIEEVYKTFQAAWKSRQETISKSKKQTVQIIFIF